AVELVRRVREGGRRADEQPLLRGLARRVVVEVHFHVVADVQIKIAVVVDVAPGDARAPVRVAQPRLGGHVRERAVAVVVVQDDLAQEGDDQVVVAVVVEVADRHPLAETGAGQARLFRAGGEGAVAVVAVEFAGRLRPPRPGPHRAVLHAEQVQPAVVVVVDPGDAGAHRLLDVVLRRGRVEVGKADPGGRGHVHEPGQARRRLGGRLFGGRRGGGGGGGGGRGGGGVQARGRQWGEGQ